MTLRESDGRLDELIQAYLDGSLAPGEAEELLEVLKVDPGVVERLLDGLRTDVLIQNTIQAVEEEVVAGGTDLCQPGAEALDPDVERTSTSPDGATAVDENEVRRIKEYAEYQLEAFLAEQERQRRLGLANARGLRSTLDVQSVATKVDRLMAVAGRAVVAAALCSVVAMAVVIPVQHFLSHRVVATLGDAAQAKWSTECPTKELRPGRMILEQGFAQVVFKSGAEVILQAPSTFRLQSSNRMFLESGRVTARVPRRAAGFTVRTSGAEVVDFGTEFGLMAGPQCSAEVHVFDGRIGLEPVGSLGSATQQTLERGEAATVDVAGHIERGFLADRPRLFVREMPQGRGFAVPGKRLNLADVVGGGNGLDTGASGQGIHPLTGAVGPNRWVVKGRGNGFVRTPSLPLIDGVFVPGSTGGPMVVSSTGITFDGSPDASGYCYEGILDGALFQHVPFEVHPGRLAGVAFNSPEHPSIGMHANAGITFDLDKIRSTMPETEISRFQALCGVSETVADYSNGTWESKKILVRFWVLVDGQVRFSKELAAVTSEPQRIDVPLGPRERFLSLITTTTDGGAVLCWSMFAEPALELSIGRRLSGRFSQERRAGGAE